MAVQITSGVLREADQREIKRIAEAAQIVDGAPPLSDSVLLGSADGLTHLFVRDDQETLIGYAVVEPNDHVIEIVVAPDHRGLGVGAQLLAAAIATGGRQLWTRGDRRTPHQLAAQAGMIPVRNLWCMARPLEPGDDFQVDLPEPFRMRTFLEDSDTDALLAINAAAFIDLPDQGSWGPDDVAARKSAKWYDPQDVILLENPDGVVGFHWTKVYPDAVTGEVYVLALDPRVQGRGLAGPLLEEGLLHLARRGCQRVLLYVDGDNESARRLYRAHGFTDERVDILYRCADGVSEGSAATGQP